MAEKQDGDNRERGRADAMTKGNNATLVKRIFSNAVSQVAKCGYCYGERGLEPENYVVIQLRHPSDRKRSGGGWQEVQLVGPGCFTYLKSAIRGDWRYAPVKEASRGGTVTVEGYKP